MKRHLVIFARAPQLGRVKRRLAEGIGPAAAARFYRATVARQIRRLARDGRWTVWLFVTPDGSLGHPAWRGVARSRVIGQGQGDLGRRMKRPFRDLPAGPVVLVGSDIPAMRPAHIAHAFRALGHHDLVFGPASDGGFWLIGARRTKPLPRTLFAKVRWSTAHALADTRATIPARFSTGMTDLLDDIDDAQDLRRYEKTVTQRADYRARTEARGL
jgi:rSAM/selenodomain-associated transferase 1